MAEIPLIDRLIYQSGLGKLLYGWIFRRARPYLREGDLRKWRACVNPFYSGKLAYWLVGWRQCANTETFWRGVWRAFRAWQESARG